MHQAYLLIGSNLPPREEWILKTETLIGIHCGNITGRSSVYETAAWGLQDQPDFLNRALELETDLSPEQLINMTQHIENMLGRQRLIKWGPRTVDIDILLYDTLIIDQPALKIPHPGMSVRKFVLIPLSELAPDFIHPVSRQSIRQMAEACTDPLPVHKYPDAGFFPG